MRARTEVRTEQSEPSGTVPEQEETADEQELSPGRDPKRCRIGSLSDTEAEGPARPAAHRLSAELGSEAEDPPPNKRGRSDQAHEMHPSGNSVRHQPREQRGKQSAAGDLAVRALP